MRTTAVGTRVRKVVTAFAFRLFCLLPVRAGSAVFESQLGNACTGNPKYVYLALRATGDDRRVVWSYRTDPAGLPADAVAVRRGSWRYYYELARAEFWVDDQGFPAAARGRRRTTYLQTWHGTPFKAMGFDEPGLANADPSRQREFEQSVQRWTHLCVQSEFAERSFATAFRHRAQPLRYGYPRNDPLLSGDVDGRGAAIRAELGLPQGRTVVLYAPTFRDRSAAAPSFGLDLDRLRADLGSTCVLLLRPHYLEPAAGADGDFTRDVSRHPDVTELMLAADVLITDYSSVMFDFALLRRPMLFYVHDLDRYLSDRGAYFDLEAQAPGAVVRDQDAATTWLTDPRSAHAPYAERHERFVATYCGFDTGHAGRDVVRAVFGGGM